MSRIFVSFFIVVIAHMCAGHGIPLCTVNSEPRPCGSLCEPTCEKPEKIFCTPADKNSCKNECRCMDGYVRNKQTGFCVKVKDCPVKPPQKCSCNETLALCGRICEPNCAHPRPLLCPRIACSKKTEACRCKNGYVRDTITKQCVLPKDCVKCGVNEEIGVCGRICEGTCQDQNPGKCAAISCTGNGCKCKERFFRNEKTDQCVPVEKCPKKCAYGEIYAACGRTCEGTCKSPFQPEICRRIRCATQDCRCDLGAGFVRDKNTGKCVRKENCGCDADDDDNDEDDDGDDEDDDGDDDDDDSCEDTDP